MLLAILFGCASGAIIPLVAARTCCPLQAACCKSACAMKKKSARSCGATPSRIELSIARWVALLDDAEESVRLEATDARGDSTTPRIAGGFLRPPDRPPRISPLALA